MTSENYEVGYAKPPKSTQFKKGHSGNPAGRPKAAKNLSTYLMNELAEEVRVTEGDKTVVINKQHAIIKSMIAMSLKGDARATNEILKLIRANEERISAVNYSGFICSECQRASKDQVVQFDLDKVLEGLGVQNESSND